jgi:hypothetical protein
VWFRKPRSTEVQYSFAECDLPGAAPLVFKGVGLDLKSAHRRAISFLLRTARRRRDLAILACLF